MNINFRNIIKELEDLEVSARYIREGSMRNITRDNTRADYVVNKLNGLYNELKNLLDSRIIAPIKIIIDTCIEAAFFTKVGFAKKDEVINDIRILKDIIIELHYL